MLGQQATDAKSGGVGERGAGESRCWRWRCDHWFLPKRGIVAVGITKVEYIALTEVRNVM